MTQTWQPALPVRENSAITGAADLMGMHLSQERHDHLIGKSSRNGLGFTDGMAHQSRQRTLTEPMTQTRQPALPVRENSAITGAADLMGMHLNQGRHDHLIGKSSRNGLSFTDGMTY